MKKKRRCVQVKGVVIGKGAPKICMPMVGRTEADLDADVEEALTLSPDLVEWRADYYKQVQDSDRLLAMLERLRRALPDIPLLFTCRDVAEGGFAKLRVQERAELVELAINSGMIDLVDIELESAKREFEYLVTAAKKRGVGVVLSRQFFTKTPGCDEIVAILREEQGLGADIAKISVMPNSPADVLTLMTATDRMYTEYAEIPLITMSMGQMGIPSRVVGGFFGCDLTFGAGRNTSAPGQIGIEELRAGLELFYG